MNDRSFIRCLAGTGCTVFNSTITGGIEPYREWYKWLSYIPKDKIDRISFLTSKECLTKDEEIELLDYRSERRMFSLFKIYNKSCIKPDEYMEVYDFVNSDIEKFMLSKLTDEEINLANSKLKYYETLSLDDLRAKVELDKKNYDNLSYLDSYILHILTKKVHTLGLKELDKIANDTYNDSRAYKIRSMKYYR